MNKPPAGLVAVDPGLVGQTLVQAIHDCVLQRAAPNPSGPVGAALDDADQAFVAGSEARVEMRMRRAGYLARAVEVELFEPAKQPAGWLEALVREHHAQSADWALALVATCAALARAEPVAKPAPDDPAAATWRVPGPGGHVRHYVARRTIEDELQGRDRPFDGNPAELKIPWVYGLFVRACEEVLPHEALGISAQP